MQGVFFSYPAQFFLHSKATLEAGFGGFLAVPEQFLIQSV
jgi:hypothetical protein